MPRLQFKHKCKVCRDKWVLVAGREYPVCVDCHMKQALSSPVKEEKYNFLNIDEEIYRQSRFLREIRRSYSNYKELTEKQISAFNETVKKVEAGEEA